MNSSLSHVAFLVSSVEKSAKFLNVFEINCEKPESFPNEGTKEIYVGNYDTQTALLLLLEPVSDGPYRRAMAKRGPSLHHIAIDVLDLNESVFKAQAIGWQLHPVSQMSVSNYQTAWLFKKGIPTLIEIQQRKILSEKPHKISKIELPISAENVSMFVGLGLNIMVTHNERIGITIDGVSLTFDQIALK